MFVDSITTSGPKSLLYQFQISSDFHYFSVCPDEIHVITYKEIQFLCEKNEIKWKNQTFMQFVNQMKDECFNTKTGRALFTTSQRQAILKRFDFECNKCECNIKDNTFEIDHIRHQW